MIDFNTKQDIANYVITADHENLSRRLELADVNMVYSNGKTLLIMAVEAEMKMSVEFLLEAGADLNKRDFYDRTPLMYAIDKGNLEIAKILIEAGADVNAKNKKGRTALMYAAYKNLVEMAEVLVQAGAEINDRDRTDQSAWNYANYRRDKKCAEFLAAKGAETRYPNIGDSNGFWDKFNHIKSMDVFSEYQNAPKWSLFDFIWYCGMAPFLIFLFSVDVSTLIVSNLCAGIILLFLSLRLLRSFPSILKLFPESTDLGERTDDLESSISEPPKTVQHHPLVRHDLEFVSHLMELGSKELISINHTHPDEMVPQEQKKIFRLRIQSAFLVLSILGSIGALYFQVIQVGSNGILPTQCFSILLFFSTWVFIAHHLEKRLSRRRLEIIQKERDRIAGNISKMLEIENLVNETTPVNFGLYLRAFMTTNKLHVKGFDFETLLAYSIAPVLPLIALGQPGEHLGSGRIQTTDEHWQEEILRLMDASRLILIIPSHRAGTLWEIETLREKGYIEKTIFIMPPEIEFYKGKYSDDWRQTVLAARKIGIELPTHIATGAFFRLGQYGLFKDYAPFASEEFLVEFTPSGGGSDHSTLPSMENSSDDLLDDDGFDFNDSVEMDSFFDGDGSGEGGGDGGGDGGGGDGGGGDGGGG